MKLSGRVWKYGDDVNTDVIFPGKYTYTVTEPKEQAKHALEDLDPTFATQVGPGDIIVGGKNWGNGSSREQAVGCLKYSGVTAIVAKSFGRIYFRNAVNNGLAPIVCAQAVDEHNSVAIAGALDHVQRTVGGLDVHDALASGMRWETALSPPGAC